MKKIKYISILTFFAIICFSGMFSSCKEEPVLDNLPRILRPVNFNATTAGVNVTISWASVDSALTYTLQVSQDSTFATLDVDTTLTGLSYASEMAGATTFYARIRANASDSLKNSKFNETLRFATPKENLFGGYTIKMTALHTIDVKWLPNAKVTSLVLTDATNAITTIALSAADIAAGEKIVADLPNSNYSVKIYKNTILRGTTIILVEGDVYLNASDDLPTAITNATSGQVIVLAPGELFSMGSATFRLSQNIKVRGLSSTNKSILAMTVGTPTSSSSMLGFVDGSTLNWALFENIDFTGYCDNNTSATKIGYLFNNNLMTTVGKLSFKNCDLHNFGNTPMRLQASKEQSVDTLSFNGCQFYDIGFSSTYAIVNVNSADYINNIYFNNCTAYNFKGSFILRTVSAPVVATMGTISITNCTINKGMQDSGSARYLLDLNNTTIIGGLTVSNCIFGSTGNAKGANGLRILETNPVSYAGNYYTTDYVDDPIPIGTTSTSIKGKMTAYPKASTDLWVDPVNGVFTLKDATFAGKGKAGDLRW